MEKSVEQLRKDMRIFGYNSRKLKNGKLTDFKCLEILPKTVLAANIEKNMLREARGQEK